jgi:Sec-independent protein translocase protein TatA
MFGISGGELLVIATVGLLIFGPTQLPELARTVGRRARPALPIRDHVNRQVHDAMRQLDQEVEMTSRPKPAPKQPKPAQAEPPAKPEEPPEAPKAVPPDQI